MTTTRDPTETVKSICTFAGQTEAVLYFWVCNQCPDFLETCAPLVSTDGQLVGAECDLYLCEDCTEETCSYYQPNIERGRELCTSI